MAGITETCEACGNPRDPSAAFCVHCGAAAASPTPAVEAGRAPTSPTPPSSPSSPPPPLPPAAGGTAPPPPQPPAPAGALSSPLQQRGFFASLFDLSFSSLIATKIIKVLYVLSIIGIGLTALGLVIASFRSNAALGVVTLFVIAPIISLFYLVWTRVILELFIALFRIWENTTELVAQGRRP